MLRSDLERKAREAGLLSYTVHDAGKTQVCVINMKHIWFAFVQGARFLEYHICFTKHLLILFHFVSIS